MKQFVFLNPIPEIINQEIEVFGSGLKDKTKADEFSKRLQQTQSEDEKTLIRKEALQVARTLFRDNYSSQMNACINERYRANGFEINFVVYKGSAVSDVINLHDSDRIIEADLDLERHRTKQPNGEYLYPDEDYILNKFTGVEKMTIAGFHLWDCVDRLAKKAHERGLDTLVDEDLTELFILRLKDPNFKIETYPTFDPRKSSFSNFDEFMKVRENRPWLWQKY